MERILLDTVHSTLPVTKRFLCRLNFHKWSYLSDVVRICPCGCLQRLNEEDARDWAEFNWVEEK